MMAGWQRAELRDLANIGGRWFVRVTNPALPSQLVPVTVHKTRDEFNAALQVPVSLEWYAKWESIAAEMYEEMLTE